MITHSRLPLHFSRYKIHLLPNASISSLPAHVTKCLTISDNFSDAANTNHKTCHSDLHSLFQFNPKDLEDLELQCCVSCTSWSDFTFLPKLTRLHLPHLCEDPFSYLPRTLTHLSFGVYDCSANGWQKQYFSLSDFPVLQSLNIDHLICPRVAAFVLFDAPSSLKRISIKVHASNLSPPLFRDVPAVHCFRVTIMGIVEKRTEQLLECIPSTVTALAFSIPGQFSEEDQQTIRLAYGHVVLS
jgi:hypothetical protein